MKATIWVWVALVVLALPVLGRAQWGVPAVPTLPGLPTLGETTRENRRSWEEQPRESDGFDGFSRQLRDEWRWREAEKAKQRRHEEMLKEMRRQHMDDMVQRENEYRRRFGARDTNCFLGRGPVWDC